MEDYSRERGYFREGDYSNSDNAYDRGNSYRRGRSATTGRYVHRPNDSRLSGEDTDMDEYRTRKREYSNSRDEGSKERMLDALEGVMSGICNLVKQMYKDSDTREEREVFQSWATALLGAVYTLTHRQGTARYKQMYAL